jgi:DNA-binding MarR family transcriptional regulator
MPTKKPDRDLHGSWMAFSFAAQLESRYRKLMNQSLRKKGLGINLREWQAIAYIASTRTEEQSVLDRWIATRSGVMRALDIDRAAASRLVSGLVAKGYLAEVSARRIDKRKKILTPGMSGRLIIKPILKLEVEVIEKLLASMGGQAAKDAQVAIEKLRRAFVRTDGLRWNSAAKDD